MPATAVTAMFTLQVPRLAQAPNPSLDTTHQTTSSGSYWADNGGSYTLTFEGSGTTIDLTDTHMYTGRYGNVDLFSLYGESSAQNTVYPYFNSRLTLRGAKGIHDPATLPGAADLPAYK